MKSWQNKEKQARRAIEDQGFVVHDANVLFGGNCPNIDLVVYARNGARYVQVRSSNKPAGSDHVIVDGSAWTQGQLQRDPIFNKHEHFRCSLVIMVDTLKTGETVFYIAPPEKLERRLRRVGREFAERPKRDGTRRSINFRKELPRSALREFRDAWHLFGDALGFASPATRCLSVQVPNELPSAGR